MKKLFVLLIILISYIPSYSQQRINDQLPIISLTKNRISQSIGWSKQEDGQWDSAINKIPKIIEKSLRNFGGNSLGVDNFIFFEVRTIKYKNEDFKILIKKYKDCDHHTYNKFISYEYYIISDTLNVSFIRNIRTKKTFNVIKYGKIQYLNGTEDYLSLIKSDIISLKKNINVNLVIEYFLFNNKIQWKLYCDNDYFSVIGLADAPRRSFISANDVGFENCYYETSIKIFNLLN